MELVDAGLVLAGLVLAFAGVRVFDYAVTVWGFLFGASVGLGIVGGAQGVQVVTGVPTGVGPVEGLVAVVIGGVVGIYLAWAAVKLLVIAPAFLLGGSVVAGALGIADWQAECAPGEKVARLEQLVAGGKRVLMVGDGLNDAPALAAASVSLSPASAADISQTAADAVFQGERLAPVLEVLETARRAGRLVHQNFGLAFAYNVVAVPLAMAGFVTPLIAAVVMSASSLAVTGNSLRLGLAKTARS